MQSYFPVNPLLGWVVVQWGGSSPCGCACCCCTPWWWTSSSCPASPWCRHETGTEIAVKTEQKGQYIRVCLYAPRVVRTLELSARSNQSQRVSHALTVWDTPGDIETVTETVTSVYSAPDSDRWQGGRVQWHHGGAQGDHIVHHGPHHGDQVKFYWDWQIR